MATNYAKIDRVGKLEADFHQVSFVQFFFFFFFFFFFADCREISIIKNLLRKIRSISLKIKIKKKTKKTKQKKTTKKRFTIEIA